MTNELGKILIALGALLCIAGAAILLRDKLPVAWLSWLGRLPGDINIERTNFSFHFPLVTCLIVSILLTIILALFRK